MSEIDKELWNSPWGIKRKAELEEELENKSKGFGDTIEKFTQMTGIKKIIKVIEEETGGDCGCNKRKEKLNELFPYGKQDKKSN